MTHIIIASPLEQFTVVPFISISLPLFGYINLSITNVALYTIITVFLIIGLHLIANNGYSIIPNRWSIAIESAYSTVHGIVREQIGTSYEVYTPFIYSIFWFILIANLNGNIPYAYTITTSAIVALGFSVFIFLGVTTIGLSKHGIHFFAYFVPSGTPLGLVPALVLIELISYLARAVSLGVRLFSNIVAGHTLLKILSTFLVKLFTSGIIVGVLTLIPFAIFIALLGLEIAVSVIQAYVFTVLVCSYIKDAELLH